MLKAEDVVEFPMTDEDRQDMARGIEKFNRALVCKITFDLGGTRAGGIR